MATLQHGGFFVLTKQCLGDVGAVDIQEEQYDKSDKYVDCYILKLAFSVKTVFGGTIFGSNSQHPISS